MLQIQRPAIEPRPPSGNRQVFNFGPLPPGFGNTMGNALRRVMLSYVPGAAVTWMRFEHALHEFDTIDGITEDVADIILNIKDLVLKSHSPDAVVLRVDVVGPASVTGADFDVNPDVEVINKDLHIATLGKAARFVIDATVEQGVGYLGAEDQRRPSSRPTTDLQVEQEAGYLGVEDQPGDFDLSGVDLSGDFDLSAGITGVNDIPIDALFSPVRRVTYRVQSIPGDSGDVADVLDIDILTDGSMLPSEVLASAGGTLRKFCELFEALDEHSASLVVSEITDYSETAEDLQLMVETLDLSTRTVNCLKRAEIKTIGNLVNMTPSALLGIPNFGEKALEEVIERLDDRGLALSNFMIENVRV